MKDKPESCLGCPLAPKSIGYCPPDGDPNSQYILLGQGPGEQEVYFNQPFYPNAPAGRRLMDWIHRAGLQRNQFYFDNSIRCFKVKLRKDGTQHRSGTNRLVGVEPTLKESKECMTRHFLKEMNPRLTEQSKEGSTRARKILLLVGLPAAKSLLGPKTSTRDAGSLVMKELP